MKVVSIEEFLELRKQGFPLVDARSEKEFSEGHISGAINMPLLINEHRAVVGTSYKVSGREIAIQKGFELAGPRFGELFKAGRKLAKNKKILVHCWRGGLRSNILSWVLDFTEADVYVLEGGYKNYRNKVHQTFNIPFKYTILGGKTGSGKTQVLHMLKNAGEQVLDIEQLASHKGSSFGALGLPPQPSQEDFENSVAEVLMDFDPSKTVWVENESRLTGCVVTPLPIYEAIRQNNLVELKVSLEQRIVRLINEYSLFEEEELKAAILRLQKKLGGQRTKEALEALSEKNHEKWIDNMLHYYDKTYMFGIEERPGKNFPLEWDWNNAEHCLKQVLNLHLS